MLEIILNGKQIAKTIPSKKRNSLSKNPKYITYTVCHIKSEKKESLLKTYNERVKKNKSLFCLFTKSTSSKKTINLNRLMSEELLWNDSRGKNIWPSGNRTTFNSRSITRYTANSAIRPPCSYAATDFMLATSFTSQWEQ